MGLSFTSETVSDHTKNLLSYIQHETLREMIKINPLLADSEPVHNHTTKWQEWVQQMEETHSFLMALAPIIDSFPGLIQLRQQDDIRKLLKITHTRKNLSEQLIMHKQLMGSSRTLWRSALIFGKKLLIR